jgi:disulfide bond formation protein DsbB
MPPIMARFVQLRTAAALILLAAAATIGGALVFEYGFGLAPCPLCLLQRKPYYVAFPVALAALLLPSRWGRAALALLAVIFVVSAGLGVYHAGVEWGWWQGPTDCSGGAAPQPGSMDDFLNQLQTTRVVSCTEAAWRFLGLSLAGWNVLISLALAGFAAWAASAVQSRPAYGSSSVSQ